MTKWWRTLEHTLSKRGRYIVSLGLLFAAYLIGATFGLSIHPVHSFASYIWPPTGIALAALTLYGYRLWPAILLGAFTANLYMGAPLLVAAVVAAGNTLEALAGTHLLKQYAGSHFSFGNLSESFIFIAGAAFSASMVSATIGVSALFAAGIIPPIDVTNTWMTWWIGDTLGALVLAPFLLRWLSPPERTRTTTEYFEMFLVAGLVFLTSAYTFWSNNVDHAYPILIPLVWAALRTGPRGMSLSLLITSIVATAGTLAGVGSYATGDVSESLFGLQLFMGTLCGVFIVFVSVVEDRRRAVEAMQGQLEQLEHALQKIREEDDVKNQFLATLAHELRNPLSPILSSIELIKMQSKAGSLLRQANIVEKHARSMSRLLDDLLDVSRISAQKLVLKKKPVYICSSIAQSVEAVQTLITAHNHTLDISIHPRPLLIEADPLRLEQIITNLLSNAAKYTPPAGRITLSCLRDGGHAIITVRDTGIGIPQSMLHRIFEPFLQVKRSDTSQGGIGIGLTLTKKLVEMHGGTIMVHSAGEGHGAEFVVRLPLPAADAFTVETPPEAKRRKRPMPGLKILVVDDNIDAANALGKLLGIRGHEVTLAVDGASALRLAPSVNPDVIVLDIGLPDMDGYSVARELRRVGVFSPLIALTGFGQESDKAKARSAGFGYHLTKPVGITKLEEALATVLTAAERAKTPVTL